MGATASALTERDEKPTDEGGIVEAWLEAIEASEKEEKDWTKDADKATTAYRGSKSGSSRQFNIFHANTETTVPSLYNSTPVADVRRRYNDDDKASKAVADLIERSLGYSIDVYDFDHLMLSCVRDMCLASRGIARVVYVPTFAAATAPPGIAPGGADEAGEVGEVKKELPEELVYSEVRCEHVSWRAFRRGPARQWSEVPWVAFEHYLSREEVKRIAPRMADQCSYLYSAEAKQDEKKRSQDVPRFGRRARFWEIWDKEERKVLFISPDTTDKIILKIEDPLSLEQFFPVPRPMTAISTPDSLVPITMYSIYSDLIDELNEVTRRIKALVKQLRVRGGYAGLSTDLKAIIEAGDGELIPFTGLEVLAASGGDLNKLITWFPLKPVVEALVQLVQHRESVKQTIYEVTGISDIVRGASDPKETLGAQQIKTQFGSIRVQRLQVEVQRFARDLFRLKSEIIGNRELFSWETLTQMTGLHWATAEEKAQVQALKDQWEASQAQAQQPPPQMMGHNGGPPMGDTSSGGMPGEAGVSSIPPPDQMAGPPMGPQPGGSPSAMGSAPPQSQMAGLTGPPAPPQAPAQPPLSPEQMAAGKKVLEEPTVEDIQAILYEEGLRSYRVDIETDSTIKGDVMRNQAQIGQFVQGLGGFFQAVGPAVQAGFMPVDLVGTLTGAFTRQMKLGRQAEDAIERWIEDTKVKTQNPPPPPPDPKMLELQHKQQMAAQDAKQREAESAQKGQISQQELDGKMQLGQQELAQKAQLGQQEMDLKREQMQAEHQLKFDLGSMQQQGQQELEGRKLDSSTEFENRKLDSANDFESRKLESSAGIERERIAASSKPQTALHIGDDGAVGQAVETLKEMAQGNSEALQASSQGMAEVSQMMGQVAQAMAQAAQQMAQSSERMALATEEQTRVASAPRELTKDPLTGRKRVSPVLN